MTLAQSLVEARLGACVQVHGPVVSTYRWEGAIHQDEEWSCVIKTTAPLIDDVLEFIADRHPYDNPELTVIPIIAGTDEYLEWITEEVSD